MKQSRKTPKITEVYRLLEAEFGAVETPLYFTKPYELAIAVILSAQCTDERVNTVTPELFRTFPTLESFAKAPLDSIEKKSSPLDFIKTKPKASKVLLVWF